MRLRPYRDGPRFTLDLYDIKAREHLGYCLRQHDRGKTTVLFEGTDFRPSPLHAWDANATLEALLGFLTLRPGDTDAGYFSHYTRAQREFCDQHAEALWATVQSRYRRRE